MTNPGIVSTLLQLATDCLNASDFDGCRKALDELKHFSLLPVERYLCLEREILLNARQGKPAEAMKLVEEALVLCPLRERKVNLLIQKGQLESKLNGTKFAVTSLSDALSLAEEIGNKRVIAKVYRELSGMFAPRYPGLGVYFLREAEVLYHELKEDRHLQGVWMYLAKLLIVIYETHCDQPKFVRFKEEAERVISLVDEGKLQMEANKAFLKDIKGYVLKDEELIDSALNYYLGIKAKDDVARIVEEYIGVCVNKGEYDKALAKMPIYKEYVGKKHGVEAMRMIESLESLLRSKQPCKFFNGNDYRRSDEPVTLFDILDNLSIGEEYWYLDKSVFRMLFPGYYQEGKFEAIKMPDGKLKLFPSSLTFNDYYRGECEFHPTCKPSLYRPWMTEAKKFVESVKYKELCLLIDQYPLTKIFHEGIAIKLPDDTYQCNPLSVDYMALAQHYGIATELMDFTVDKFVAAFFASTDYDKDTDTYSPHDESKPVIRNGKKEYVTDGCFYHYVDVPSFPLDKEGKLRAVGMQPFPRPGEQTGYVLRMNPEDDLNKLAKATHFQHDKKVSEFIFHYTNRSKNLFPKSALHDKAMKIRDSKSFSREAFHMAWQEFYPAVDEQTMLDYLAEEGITLHDDRVVNFTQEEIDQFYQDWQEHGEQDFFQKLLIRYSYTGPMKEVSGEEFAKMQKEQVK